MSFQSRRVISLRFRFVTKSSKCLTPISMFCLFVSSATIYDALCSSCSWGLLSVSFFLFLSFLLLPPILLRCHNCPDPFTRRAYEDGRCSCDCFEKQKPCLKIKKGREALGALQRRQGLHGALISCLRPLSPLSPSFYFFFCLSVSSCLCLSVPSCLCLSFCIW